MLLALVRPWVGGTGLLYEDRPHVPNFRAADSLISYFPAAVVGVTASFNGTAYFRPIREPSRLNCVRAVPARVIFVFVIGAVVVPVKVSRTIPMLLVAAMF